LFTGAVSGFRCRRRLIARLPLTNPALTAVGALQKIGAAFSWRLNPVREPLAEAAYFFSWAPISVLGGIGLWLNWRRHEVILIWMTFISFVFVTAIFWAHTSHRSYLDVYWIVLAASVIERIAESCRVRFGQFSRS
jgi:hypothetical protein